MRLLVTWFESEDWMVVLSVVAILALALATIAFIGWFRLSVEVRILKWRFNGLIERVSGAYRQIETVSRRVTGEVELGSEEDTKMKKASKKLKHPEDFDYK